MSSIVSWLVGAEPTALNPLDDRYYETSIGYPSRSGVVVSAESSRKVATVYRCISILANTLAMFPKGMFERLDRGRRPAPEHPLDSIIGFKPNRRQTAFEFWRLIAHHLILRQNAFVQIVQGNSGRGWVGELVPLHPDRVSGPEEMQNGSLRYEYHRKNGEKIPMLGGIDIWHLQGLSDDGLRGLSMMELASDSMGLSIAAERHASRFFERGVKPSGILQSDRPYKREVAEAMGDSFAKKYGGESGSGAVPVLWDGMKFETVAMNLKDAEFLDSRKFSVTEIARWFGVPPHMVGDVERSTSWGTGIEVQGLQFLIYSLQPWIELMEQSIRFTLVVQEDRFYPKFNVSALLRMDAKTQAAVFESHIQNGILSPNECRELLERNPREGGDEYVDPAKAAAPPPAPPRPPDDPDDSDDDADEPPADAHAADVRQIAAAHVSELLAIEKSGLVEMAAKHAKSQRSWRAAVTGFYGRFSKRIAETGLLPSEAAKQWCVARRDIVLSDGGLYEMTTDGTPASDDALLGGL